MDDEQIEIDTDDARAGTTPHIVRYVLIVSMVLAVVGMGVVVLIG